MTRVCWPDFACSGHVELCQRYFRLEREIFVIVKLGTLLHVLGFRWVCIAILSLRVYLIRTLGAASCPPEGVRLPWSLVHSCRRFAIYELLMSHIYVQIP